jgi:hypothetical protein
VLEKAADATQIKGNKANTTTTRPTRCRQPVSRNHPLNPRWVPERPWKLELTLAVT